MADVKNIQEVLEAIELMGVAGKQVMKDGKVDLADLPTAIGLLSQLDKVVKAVDGIDQIPAEVKDITSEEAKVLIEQVLKLIAAIKAA